MADHFCEYGSQRGFVFTPVLLVLARDGADGWQAAMEALLLVAEHDGPTMFARIGIMKALNRNVERVFNPSRKDTHWGQRKPKRDT